MYILIKKIYIILNYIAYIHLVVLIYVLIYVLIPLFLILWFPLGKTLNLTIYIRFLLVYSYNY
jgi:hypothetical protein